MSRLWTLLAIACFALPFGTSPAFAQTAATTDPVVQWNQTLLKIVRTHGAQPATVHPTRSFAIMHAAIYDAVNSIDGTHQAYLVRLERVSAPGITGGCRLRGGPRGAAEGVPQLPIHA